MSDYEEDVYEEDVAFLRIPLKDIEIATNNFDEKNLLKRGEISDVYKGVLPLKVPGINDVVIRKYNNKHTFDFYQEIYRIHRMKYMDNIVSLIGFCDEKNERMIVMEHVVNGGLDDYLSDPITLTWLQRLHVCFGAARTLGQSYYYYSIMSFKILLDKDWEAKILVSVESDTQDSSVMYSLGIILLEVLYGRKATIEDVIRYLAKKKTYDEQLDDIIDPNLRKQMLPESLSLFAEAADECLMEENKKHLRVNNEIVRRLKEAFDIQWEHENILQVEKVAYLKISLEKILLATNGFDETYRFGTDDVYKAEVDHFDRDSALIVERENEDEQLKRKTVIIKRINDMYMTKDSFIAEVEMLISCKHPNLMSLLGICHEGSERILVYDGAYKETLDEYFKRNGRNKTNYLTWDEKWIHISLHIAHGLKYLQSMESKPASMRHQLIDSTNIILDKKWNAKIATIDLIQDYSFSNKLQRYIRWEVVIDDIFFLGVVLFEILNGGSADDHLLRHLEAQQYIGSSENHLLRHLEVQMYMADHNIQEINVKNSLETLTKITYQCLRKTPSERPTLEVIIKSLEIALQFQVYGSMKIPLDLIKLATNNFDKNFMIGEGGYGEVYKAELNLVSWAQYIKTKRDFSKLQSVAIKRIMHREDKQGKQGFLAEINVLSKCDHPNIVTLIGFCDEDDEMLLVYERVSNGSLNDYLGSTDKIINLKWAQRLNVCIDIANGLDYLHTNMDYGKRNIIHRDIKSDNILLGDNWEAKIADFGLSKIQHENQQKSTMNTNVAGTNVYVDPEYAKTHRLKKASDIYSFGVVLFEIFTGTLAYDKKYTLENGNGIAPIARDNFIGGTLKGMLDLEIMNEVNDELGFSVKLLGPNHDSLDAFSRIAYKCIATTQAARPTIKVVIEELQKALNLQENMMKTLKSSLESIQLGLQNFTDARIIMRGGYGKLYKQELQFDNNSHKKVIVKRFSLDRCINNGIEDIKLSSEHRFLNELDVLFRYKHQNIIGLFGYCKEMKEKIIIYDHSSKKSLDTCIMDVTASLSWITRLRISLDIAYGLRFLHGGDMGLDVVIHRDIKSSNILLTKDWKAKICGFEHAITYPANTKIEYVKYDGSPGYCDPLYSETNIFTKESDIYSFGVVLFEILCGRLACHKNFKDNIQFLDGIVKEHFQKARVEEIVFEGIREQMVQESFVTFRRIAFKCLNEEREERPTAGEVLVELQKALKFQEDYERRESELLRNYKRLRPKEILMEDDKQEDYQRREAELHSDDKQLRVVSKAPDSTMVKTYIKDILSKGILTEDDKQEIIRDIQKTI